MNTNDFALAPILSRRKKQRIAKASPKSDLAYVYFIENRSNEQTKIGRSKFIGQRIKGITGSKGAREGEYAVHGYITVSHQHAVPIEAGLHREFAGQRVDGEWFDLLGQNLLDAAIRVARDIAGVDFKISGLSSDVLPGESMHVQANKGICWMRRKGISRGERHT